MVGTFTDTRPAFHGKLNPVRAFSSDSGSTYQVDTRTFGAATSVSTPTASDSQNVRNTVPLEKVTSYRSRPSRSDGALTNAEILLLAREGVPDRYGIPPDNGHEFNATKFSWTSHQDMKKISYIGSGKNRYMGPVGIFDRYSSRADLGFTDSGSRGCWELIPNVNVVYGTKAINILSPTTANGSIGSAILELKDGLPHLPGLAFHTAKRFRNLHKVASDEFFNVVFGIMPSLGDVRSFFANMLQSYKVLNQLARDQDRLVRRRMQFPVTRSTQSWTGSPSLDGFYSVFPYRAAAASNEINGWVSSVNSVSRTRLQTQRVWFSGAFRYHIDFSDSVWARFERTHQSVQKLLGSDLDAFALWQAMPWSWLVDWFADIGDILENADNQALNGQLLQWGYLMCETHIRNTIHADRVQFRDGPSMVSLTSDWVSSRKERVKATPFGFGVNPSSLSETQWTILGALGLSKGPKTLW